MMDKCFRRNWKQMLKMKKIIIAQIESGYNALKMPVEESDNQLGIGDTTDNRNYNEARTGS